MTHFIIVLGTSDHNSLVKRVDFAIKEFNKNKFLIDTTVIFSGRSPEAETMEKLFLQKYDYSPITSPITSPPNHYTILENKSRNTIENLMHSLHIIDNHRLQTENISVAIVSSAFHIPRVKILGDIIMSKYKPTYVKTNEPLTKRRVELETMYIKELTNRINKNGKYF